MGTIKATLRLVKQPYIEKYTLDCDIQKICCHMTNADSGSGFYKGEVMTLNPPCYHNRPISGSIVDSGSELPPCLASLKAGRDNVCWGQKHGKNGIIMYSKWVDPKK